MADTGENPQESHRRRSYETESRSIEEEEEEHKVRTRQETETSHETEPKKKESEYVVDYREPNWDETESPSHRDVELYMRRNQRFLGGRVNCSPKKRNDDDDEDDDRTHMRHEAAAQSSEQRKRRRVSKDCHHFVRNGHCKYGSSCHYNHPDTAPPPPNCKFFMRGGCNNGSACRFNHPKDKGRVKPIRQERTIRHSQEDASRERYKRARTEQGQGHGDVERQRREAQESDIERQGREEAQENVQEIPEDQNVVVAQDIETQRREARLRLEQIRPTVQFTDAAQFSKTLSQLGIKKREGDGF
ncbi:unnamed protein product [Cochlearia groenlandica]